MVDSLSDAIVSKLPDVEEDLAPAILSPWRIP